MIWRGALAPACVAAGATAVNADAQLCSGPSARMAECRALASIGRGLSYSTWIKGTNAGWLDRDVDWCDWHGVSCNADGRVVGLDLSHHGIDGFVSDAIGGLQLLEKLDLTGHRPASYNGCADQKLHKSTLPASLWTNCTALRVIKLEYTCLAGPLPAAIGGLKNLTDLSLHGNYFNGSIPGEVGQLEALQTFKLGRNPFVGGFPNVSTLHELLILSFNFCSLTGPVPDIFRNFPKLQVAYFDGNGFTGPLPPSLAACKQLWSVSFNINSMSGPVPAGYCNGLPLLTDCRIGGDTNLSVYQAAGYDWLQPAAGNVFDCASLPACATGAHGAVCDRTEHCGPNGAWTNTTPGPCSPIKCH